MPKWSDIRVMKFLDIYEKHECLWNPRIEDYKNKYAKNDALDEIIRELDMPGLSRNDIKLKIKSIRTTYKRELTCLLEALSGKDDQKVAMPRLFWFKRADSFLRAVSRCRKTGTNVPLEYLNAPIKNENKFSKIQIKSGCSYNQDQQDDYNACSGSNNQNNKNRQRVNNTTEFIEEDKISVSYNEETCENNEFMDEDEISVSYNVEASTEIPELKQQNDSQTQNNYRRTLEEDEYVVFCKSVAAQLRAIPDLYSRSVAKLKIQQILFEAETGHYKQGSYVTIEPAQ